jgi:hypothetical protein
MKNPLQSIATLVVVSLTALGCRNATGPTAKGTTGRSANFDVTAGATTVFHSVGNARFGVATWSTPSDTGFVALNLSAEGPFLVYAVSDCCSFNFGFGLIPAGDVTGNSESTLVLNTNTSTDPGFFTVGASGLVSMVWDRSSISQVSHAAFDSSSVRGVIVRVSRVDQSSLAAASGGVVGFTVPPSAAASMGLLHDVAVIVFLP